MIILLFCKLVTIYLNFFLDQIERGFQNFLVIGHFVFYVFLLILKGKLMFPTVIVFLPTSHRIFKLPYVFTCYNICLIKMNDNWIFIVNCTIIFI